MASWVTNGDRLVVPAHFWLEVVNALLAASSLDRIVRSSRPSIGSTRSDSKRVDVDRPLVDPGRSIWRNGTTCPRTTPRTLPLRPHSMRRSRRSTPPFGGPPGSRAVRLGAAEALRGARYLRTPGHVAVVPGRIGLPFEAARRGRSPGVAVRALPSRHDGRASECRDPPLAMGRRRPPGGPPRPSGWAVLREPRRGRLDDPEGRTGRRRRTLCSPSGVGSSRRRRGRRSTPTPPPSSSDRSSRKAARWSTPGRSRVTSTRPRRARTSSRSSGRHDPGVGSRSPRSIGWRGSTRSRPVAGSRAPRAFIDRSRRLSGRSPATVRPPGRDIPLSNGPRRTSGRWPVLTNRDATALVHARRITSGIGCGSGPTTAAAIERAARP